MLQTQVDLTIVFYSISVLLIATVAFLLFLLSLPPQPHTSQRLALRCFSGFFVMSFLAYVCFCLRFLGWYGGSVIIGNSLYLCSMYLFYCGIRARYQKAIHRRLGRFAVLHVGIYTLMMGYFSLADDAVLVRVSVFIASMCLPLLLSLRVIKQCGHSGNLGDRILQLTVLLALGIFPILFPIFSYITEPDMHQQIIVGSLVALCLQTLCIGGLAISYIYDLIDKLRNDAHTDKLTNSRNRRYFFKVMPTLLVQASDRQTCLVMIDIDHFKMFNDQYGHQVGDRVLQHFANVVRQQLQEQDLLIRYGGEEFALILIGYTQAQAVIKISEIQQHLQHSPLVIDELVLAVKASYGLGMLDPNLDLDANVKRADAALYKAKQQGRDRFEIA